MKMVQKLATAAALLLFAGTAHAQQQKFDIANWTIYPNADNCRALTDFPNGTVVSIAIYAKNERTTMMILNDTIFASATNRAPFDAKLAFVKGDDLDTAWLGQPVNGAVLDNGSKGVFINASGDGLLKSFENSEVAGLLRGTDALVSFKTEPAAQIGAALRKCVAGK